ncbi:MAG: 3-phosphoshikimate 1-carboxyvinyltransferase [Gammaproteobacteria bacterium]|nr:3-phosphoshikimate 1-carboxyvinyltransferase [Gammaproteobacteria bacterium]
MHLIVRKTAELNGQATPPGSKSQAVRAMLLSLLAQGESRLHNLPASDDIDAVIGICRQLGAHVTKVHDGWQVVSQGLPLQSDCQKLHSGNSGITTRFVMPMLGLRQNAVQPIILDCDQQMRRRPIQPLVDALVALGLTINYCEVEGCLPVKIYGRLRGGKTSVNGLTSQYLSALLLSLPCADGESIVKVVDLHERPYNEMTLNWLQSQELHYEHYRNRREDVFTIRGGQQWQPQDKLIAADFSSTSYLVAAAVMLPGRVVLSGIDMTDPQGDKRLVAILQEMGADIVIDSEQQRLIIHGGSPLRGRDIDANDIPDLLPTLAIIATQASGKTRIANVGHARIKETDRIHSMAEGLAHMGAKVMQGKDYLTIYQSELHGAAKLNGYGDHRTVMALALAGMLATGESVIEGAEAINKTFPQFVEMMQSLGADMEMKS